MVKRRTRRAIGDPNDESLIGDDVEDATSTPKVENLALQQMLMPNLWLAKSHGWTLEM